MTGLAWILLGASGLVRDVLHVQGAAIATCRAEIVFADCWRTASVPHRRRPTLSLLWLIAKVS